MKYMFNYKIVSEPGASQVVNKSGWTAGFNNLQNSYYVKRLVLANGSFVWVLEDTPDLKMN